jgi:acyl-coenzyme A thioesterase PaaI-like protein
MKSPQLKLDKEAVSAFLFEVYPPCAERIVIETLAPMSGRIRYRVSPEDWRPGGTVSGPTIFTAADASIYVLTLSMIGKEALSVTSSLHITFLRKPSLVDLICEARLIKLGRTTAVGDCMIYSDGDPKPVAQATVTYAIPQN